MRAWIFLLILFCTIPLSFTQELNYRNYDIEHGLVQTQITCLLEDSRGFIWFGTYGGGLSRFNGRDFETFDRTRGLTNEVVTSIFEDQNKILWVGTTFGVFKFDGIRFVHMNPDNGFPEGIVWEITGGNGGDIYFSDTKKGVVNFRNGEVVEIPELSGFSDKNVVVVFFEKNGSLWIGSDEGLSRLSAKKHEKIRIEHAPEKFQVTTIFVDSSRRLWVGSHKGLYLRENNKWKSFTLADGLPSLQIWVIHESSDGLIRIGTKGGLAVFDGIKFTPITQKEGLVNNYITAIVEDRENNIWIGTDGGVSKQLRWFPFKSYTFDSGLKNNNIWSFFEDKNNNILVSTDKGSDLISSDSGKVIPNTLSYADKTFYPMVNDRSGATWLCSENSILLIKDEQVVSVYDKWDKTFDFIYDVFQDSRDRIWFAAYPGSILMYEKGKFSQFKNEEFFEINSIFCISEDKEQKIWFGSERGLFYFEKSEFRKSLKFSELEKHSVSDILNDKKGRFWIGTYSGGIILADPILADPLIERFEYPERLPEKNILSMIFDNSGDLWAGTNVGFFRINLNNFTLNESDKYLYFSGNVGMKRLKCNENAIFKDSTGRIWIGTQTGAIVFNPDIIGKSFPDPITHITDIKLFQGDMDIEKYCDGFHTGTNLPKKLVLPYNQNHLTFSYIGITSAIPDKVKYRWKLEPVDSNWSRPSSQKQITYSNLSSGNYRFTVKCSTGLLDKDIPAASFRFTITSPFWRSNIFLYLFAFILLFTAFSFYYYKSTGMKKREGDLQEKIRERTQELIIEKNKVELINRELEERVIERTNELEQKSMQLVQAQKLEIIGSLAGGVAHDLNNILSGVVSYPDLLLKNIPEDSPHRKYVEIIKNSGEKAAEMVQDLLTLTRKGVINKEPISINEIVNEFLKSPVFTKLKKNHPNISYITDLSSEKTSIFGSSIHITKTIMNLIINASEALPIDGAIEISTIRCFLDKPLKGYDRVNEGEYIKLVIKDNGIGIAEEDIENIFEPFFSKKRMGKSGTGLGMTVVLWTIKDHYGYVIVNSIKGKGTEFQLYFPAAIYDFEDEKEMEESEINTKHVGSGEHILIIEDDENNRQLAEEILSECNFRVSSVSSGEEAIEFVRKNKVDLLILDMIMGGIDGLETYIQILMHKGEQRAIITSGYSENENVKETLKLGAGSYIKKPYLKMQLIKAVETELRKTPFS